MCTKSYHTEYSLRTKKFYKEISQNTARKLFETGKKITFASYLGVDHEMFLPLHLTKDDFCFDEILDMCKMQFRKLKHGNWCAHGSVERPHFYIELPPPKRVSADTLSLSY